MLVQTSNGAGGASAARVALPPRTPVILAALWLTVFTSASQTIIITPILPVIGAALDVAPGRLGWLVSAYAWVLAAAALVMGPISDRIGRRRVLLAGSGALAVALGLHAFADSFGLLVGMRVLAGVGGGMLSGAAVSFVGDFVPYERRGWATGWVMSGVPAGLILGIPLGRMLAVVLGYKAPFVAFAVPMALAFAFVALLVPQPDVARAARPTVRGALAQYGAFLGRSGPAAATVIYFLMFLSLGLLVVYLPQWLTERFPLALTYGGRPLTVAGLPLDFIATLFFAGGLASVAVGPRAGALSDRIGRRPLILASCLGLAVVTGAITFAVVDRWAAYALYVAIMGLFALRMTPLQALLTALVPDTERGAFLAMTIAVGQIGTGLGATLGGVLYAGPGYRASTLVASALMLVIAWIVWRWLPEPTEDAPLPDEDVAQPVAVGDAIGRDLAAVSR